MYIIVTLLLPVTMFILGYWFWKTRNYVLILVALVLAGLYFKFQPSYLPKNDIPRTSVRSFDSSSSQVEDRNRKPIPSEVLQTEQQQKYKEGLPFIQSK